jgi:fatty acid desaturase
VSTAPDQSSRFVRDAYAVVRDLMTPDPLRYWVDFIATVCVMYSALGLALRSSQPIVVTLAAMAVSSLAMYRAVVFTHEIAHRTASFRGFALAWNVLCGIPLLVPSFLYGDHKGHHANHLYGTWGDPEYLVNGSRSPLRRTAFLLLALVYPVLPLFRFLVLTPIACVSRRVDRFVWTWGSSLYVMNETYHREFDRSAASPARWAQEIACAVWAWALVGFVVSGVLPLPIVVRLYVVVAAWMFLNQIRTLAAHQYANESGAAMTYLDQVLDTNTFPHGRVVPNLWAPLGMRYHALHHLMPSLPYHALGEAHRRLAAGMPPGSPYHRTVKPGLWSALITWRASRLIRIDRRSEQSRRGDRRANHQ